MLTGYFFSSYQIPEAVKRSEPASEWVAAWLSFIKADIMDLRYILTQENVPRELENREKASRTVQTPELSLYGFAVACECQLMETIGLKRKLGRECYCE
jgi:hypothetical protein